MNIHYHWSLTYKDPKTNVKSTSTYHVQTGKEAIEEFKKYAGKRYILESCKFELDPFLHYKDSINVVIGNNEEPLVEVINRMDTRIRDSLLRLDLLTEPQVFVEAYIVAHKAKHGSVFR